MNGTYPMGNRRRPTTPQCGWLFGCSLALTLLALGACREGEGGHEPPSRAQCEQAREQLAQLQLPSGAATAPYLEDERAKHHRALVMSMGEDFLVTCQEQRSRDWVECVLAARERAEARACDGDSVAPQEQGWTDVRPSRN